ncbi:MAG: LAGLIDADG family homing endonuclease [Candidatus Baltobacteraceae bacterium]
MSDAPLAAAASVPKGLSEPSFDPNAMRVLNERYFAKKADGTTETPKEFLWRVASAIALPERRYAHQLGRDPEAVASGVAHAFYDLMARRDFMPNTPCLVNAGRPLSMLSACFVLPVPDSIEGIFYNLKAMALIQKSGGGCIAGDSRVWSTFCGVEPIEVLFARTTADGRSGVKRGNGVAYDVSDLGIQTLSMDPKSGETGLRQVTHVWSFDVPVEQQYVVRTREGVELQTSAWHPFVVLRGAALAEIRADELQAGDILLGTDRPDAFWPHTELRTAGGLTLDPQLAWLIGFTLGDGSFGRHKRFGKDRVRWFSGTEDVLERVRQVLARHDIRVRIQQDTRGECRYVTTLDQPFVHALRSACGVSANGPKDATIRLPETIGKSPLGVVRAFVAGLLDSDGCVDADGSPSYATASEAMAQDLAALMSLLGYKPSVRRKEPHGRGKLPAYNVLLCRLPEVNRLAADLQPYLANVRRRERLQSDSSKESALPLAYAVWKPLLRAAGVQGSATHGAGACARELNDWSIHDRVDRSGLEAVAKALSASDAALGGLLRNVATRGQEIVSVERARVKAPFYDLSVADWNTYAAGRNGLAIVHNTGFSFSDLRHQGARVDSTGKDASGPVSFMKVFNAATDSIKQGGVRRGANMGVLRVDHPDVFQFMRCKKELDAENRALWNRLSDCGRYSAEELAHIKQELLQTQISNFNISIGVTDEFMQAVKADADFALRDPRTKEAVCTVKAREIWDGIVEGAWQNGEPGVLFLDHPEANPLPGLGPIQATNPCVTGDTWVHTFDGPRQVKDLIGMPFGAIVDGEPYASTEDGFFFTGVKAVVRLETDTGASVTATPDHKIMTLTNSGERKWKQLGELQAGDRVSIHQHERFVWDGPGTFEEGVLLGSLVGDGHFHQRGEGKGPNVVLSCWGEDADFTAQRSASLVRQRVRVRSDFEGCRIPGRGEIRLQSTSLVELAAAFGITAENKHVGSAVETASHDFYRGFLQGWFDADGTVGGSAQSGFYVRLTSSDLDDLRAAQRMLNRLGIVSRIYRNRPPAAMRTLPDGHGGKREYACSAYHELSIPWRSLEKFARVVGFAEPKKARKLADVNSLPYSAHAAKPYAVVREVVDAGFAPVYDCTIPGPHAFDANTIYVSNCGEQFLHGFDSCNLGSINVGHFYDASAKDVDWERLAQATTLAIRFLDNVIDANIYPLAEIEEMVKGNRRVGLGIMGFADLLIELEIAYGSPQAIEFAGKLMKFIQQRAVEASELLARERGDFPNKHLSTWAGDPRPRRNAALLSIAPTGTISMIAGCSFGCEPYFGMAYTKHVMKDAEGRPQHLYYVVPLFEEVAKDEGFFSDELLAEIENNRGSLKGLPGAPKHWQEVFTVAADVTVDQHIDMLAAFQKYTCNAVSKCVAEGTLIPTDRGLIPIEQMGIAAEGTFGELNDTYHVVSHDGRRRRVTGFYSNGRVKTVRIRTKNGATLEASETHHVLTIDGWKAMADLQVGDLIVGRFEEISGAGGAPIDVSPYPFRNTATPVTLPEVMSPELALWLGMMAAGGHTVESTGNVGISEKDDSGDVARTFDALCTQLFQQRPRVVFDKRSGVRTRHLTSRALARYVADSIGRGAGNKHVPAQILRGSATEKIAFLNGVSLDGYLARDAHRNALVVYSGISRNLADELEALCRSLGVPACYRWTETKADGYVVHQVRVTSELQELLDPVESRKGAASANPQRLVRLPNEVFAMSLSHSHSEFSNLRSLEERRPQHCFASTLEKPHVPLADPKEYLVKVASIETSEAQTYDIEVEESHSYVVNGLVSHNTINAPNDDTRENVSRAIFRAYEKGCKGFTYYRDGSRTEQVVTFSKDGDLKAAGSDAAAAPAAKAQDELDIDALLAKAKALLEVR